MGAALNAMASSSSPGELHQIGNPNFWVSSREPIPIFTKNPDFDPL